MTTREQIQIAEYRSLRSEVVTRAKFLHLFIERSAFLGFLALVAGLWLESSFVDPVVYQIYIALLPLVFAGVCFNFQANQLTLEVVAAASDRLRKSLAPSDESWDDQFGRLKLGFILTSVLKDFALIAPIAVALIAGYQANLWQVYPIIFAIDHLSLFLVALNFWYKRR